ncbi:MAG: hypothetical protein FWC97_07715 [Treponema sp.]|nr:hypothetical protein [Treponema sp.]
MAQAKLSFDDFIQGLDADNLAFAQNLHDYLLNNGCKVTFEEKKTSLLGSYKYTKTKRSIINLLLKKYGLVVRIYGENTNGYRDFLNTLPEEMVQPIESAGICKKLVHNACSLKCTGYDFTIGKIRYQKCKYNCFEFLVTKKSKRYIKQFVENELNERAALDVH